MEGVGDEFAIAGRLREFAPHGSGHIHDTFVGCYDTGTGPRRVLFQRINCRVFRDPAALMANWIRICEQQRRACASRRLDPDRRCLRVLPARDGRPYWVDPGGDWWRALPFVEGTRSVDAASSAGQACEAARAFAEFADWMRDLPGPPLTESIPHFHDLTHRYAALDAAIRADAHGRARAVEAETSWAARAYERLVAELREAGAADVPVRIVHNDCKLNNVLFDAASGQGLCVIDLDTVMAGTVLNDFGELMRTSAFRAAEDEARLDAVRLDAELLAGLARGYLEGSEAFLTAAEREALPLAGSLMAFENGIRFLTDHLSGDAYFRIRRPGHNLDRFRSQRRRLELMDDQRAAIRATLAAGGA